MSFMQMHRYYLCVFFNVKWYHLFYFHVFLLHTNKYKKHCSSKRERHSITKIIRNPARSTKCWTHNQPSHDFFLNYRVNSEGKKSPLSQAVSVPISRITLLFLLQFHFRNQTSKMELSNSFTRNLQWSDTKEILFIYFMIKNAFALDRIGNEDSFKDWQHLKLSSCSSPAKYDFNQ